MKLVILDRDGTINEDSDAYIKSPAEWRPIKGSLEAIARLTQADYRIVVATNQSGIARKYFDTRTLFSIHETLLRALAPRIRVNAVCPGFVNTRWMVPKLGEEGLAAFRKTVAAIAPLEKLVEPEDVAEAIKWFALGGRAITGQLLVVDAGTHLCTATPLASARDP